jgi:hypothetical protein
MIRIENAIARERERRKADWNNLGRRAGQWDGVRMSAPTLFGSSSFLILLANSNEPARKLL